MVFDIKDTKLVLGRDVDHWSTDERLENGKELLEKYGGDERK